MRHAIDTTSGDMSSARVRAESPQLAYRTDLGSMLIGSAEAVISSNDAEHLRGRVDLVFTSPPFPLRRKKRYGNLSGEDYLEWIAAYAAGLRDLLSPTGSIVVEIGNAWEPGEPVMSTLPIQALLRFLEAGELNLCEEFICHNPARLPGPAQWVNIERIRVKDAFTRLWWMAPTTRPKADNRRVLAAYGKRMMELLAGGEYNAGKRPSEHAIGATSFLKDNGGAIPSNVLTFANTGAGDRYQKFCRARNLPLHPARMPSGLAEFFIRLLTEPGDLVFDPFAGSNVTGAAAEALGRRWLSVELNREYAYGSEGRFVTAPDSPSASLAGAG